MNQQNRDDPLITNTSEVDRGSLVEELVEIWQAQNKAAIKAYNAFVERHGCFSDEYRLF